MDKAVALSFQSSEGIDTVSIEIFSDFVNTEKWLNGRQISAGISLEVRVSKFKNYYFCHIQTENLRWNILSCVLKIAEKLCKAEYIILNAKDDLFRFIFINRHNIMRLAELDFYFDFTRKELQIPSEEITGKRRFETTVYSADHKKRKSLWIMYARIDDLIFRNQLPKDFIKTIPYPTRIEIRLCRANCEYLHLDNIWGTYYQIFRRYQNFIAKSWKKHGFVFGKIPFVTIHPFFNHILYLSGLNKPLKVHGLHKTPKALNKITEKDIYNEELKELKNPLQDDEIYDELYGDSKKYKVHQIQVINNHCLYSYIRNE